MNKLGFLIFFSLYALINIYVFLRGRQALPKDLIVQLIYTVLFVAFSTGFFVAIFFEGKVAPAISSVADNLGGFWMITLLYFVMAALLGDLLRMDNYFFGIFPQIVVANYAKAKLLYFGAVMGLLLILTVVGYIRFSNPATVVLNLDVAKKSTVQSFTIVAVSDVHLGDVIRKKRLAGYVDLINKQNADVILIAGDLFDRNLHTVIRQKMDDELKRLKAPYGVYAVLGNHEYYGNLGMAVEMIQKSGIRLLRDTVVNIDNKLLIAGRDDATNRRRKPLNDLLAPVNGSLPLVLLDHQPLHLQDAARNEVDLQISGHTHNGQIFPMNKIVDRIYELGYGYRKTGNTHYYVSSGLGLWGAPIRLGTQSEIVKINLRFTE